MGFGGWPGCGNAGRNGWKSLRHIVPMLDRGFLEMTIPDKPNSRLQKYRLTAKGQAFLQREK